MTPTELRQRRKALGLTQEQLAQRLGVTTSTVVRWERGTVPPLYPVMLEAAMEKIEHEKGPAS